MYVLTFLVGAVTGAIGTLASIVVWYRHLPSWPAPPPPPPPLKEKCK